MNTNIDIYTFVHEYIHLTIGIRVKHTWNYRVFSIGFFRFSMLEQIKATGNSIVLFYHDTEEK